MLLGYGFQHVQECTPAPTRQPAAIVSPFCASLLCHLKLIQHSLLLSHTLRSTRNKSWPNAEKDFSTRASRYLQCMNSKPCLKHLHEIQGVALGKYNYLKDLIKPALFPQWNRADCQRQIGSTRRILSDNCHLTGDWQGQDLNSKYTKYIYSIFFPPRLFCLFGWFF